MENFNVNFQQQIASKTVMQIGYVGSQGHHFWRFFDLNQPSSATINACDLGQLPAATGCVAGTIQDFGQAARPFGGYGTGNPYGAYYVMQENSSGQSNYNSLQASYPGERMAWDHFDCELCVVEVAGQFERRRGLCAERCAAAMTAPVPNWSTVLRTSTCRNDSLGFLATTFPRWAGVCRA